MAKLYANENFPQPVVVRLRALGHDVRSVLDDGLAGIKFPDDEVLKRATSLGYAILTFNRHDFFRLHTANHAHAGIIICKDDTDFGGLATRIHAMVSAHVSLAGVLLRVNRHL